jgi:hypothetical protein
VGTLYVAIIYLVVLCLVLLVENLLREKNWND